MDVTPCRGALARARTLATVAATAVVVTLGLAACGTPPPDLPAPAATVPTFTGISIEASDHSVAVRDLYVPDPGDAGYPAGGKAPLEMQLWNNTTAEIALTGATLGKTPLELIGGSEASSTTINIAVPPGGTMPLTQATGRYLQVACLPADAPKGSVLPITLTFSNKATISVAVPVGIFAPDATAVPTSGAASC